MPTSSPASPPPSQCPSCKAPLDAASRIADLEAQLQLLINKASAPDDKLSQPEEFSRLNSLSPPTATSPTSPTTLPTPALAAPNRFSSIFSTVSGISRRSIGPPPDVADLARERQLRIKAEERLTQATDELAQAKDELEDLTASLFQSANEMVADERRIRSKLEERVTVLERREKEKRERLGVLERAVDRISRVREMLTGGGGTASENGNTNTNGTVTTNGNGTATS